MLKSSEISGIIKYATERVMSLGDYLNTFGEEGVIGAVCRYRDAIAEEVRPLSSAACFDTNNNIELLAFENELKKLNKTVNKIGRNAPPTLEYEELFLTAMLDELRLTQSQTINGVIKKEVEAISEIAYDRMRFNTSFGAITEKCHTWDIFLDECPSEVYLKYFSEYAENIPDTLFSSKTPASIKEAFWQELDADGIFGKCLPGFFIHVRDELESKTERFSHEEYYTRGLDFLNLLWMDILSEAARGDDKGEKEPKHDDDGDDDAIGICGIGVLMRRRQADFVIKHATELLESLEKILLKANYPSWAVILYRRAELLKEESMALMAPLYVAS